MLFQNVNIKIVENINCLPYIQKGNKQTKNVTKKIIEKLQYSFYFQRVFSLFK